MQNIKLNRILSKPLTAVLLKTPVTPNQVTFFNLFLGILAGFLFSKGSYLSSLAGALVYQLLSVLDNCDGEIARAKNLRSTFGGWLDILVDFINDTALFVGITIGLLKIHPSPIVLLLGILAASGNVFHCLLVIAEKIKGFGPAVFNQDTPQGAGRENIFYKLFNAFREGEASWFVVLFALAGKSGWILILGAFYMQVLWISALALNFKYLRKMTYEIR